MRSFIQSNTLRYMYFAPCDPFALAMFSRGLDRFISCFLFPLCQDGQAAGSSPVSSFPSVKTARRRQTSVPSGRRPHASGRLGRRAAASQEQYAQPCPGGDQTWAGGGRPATQGQHATPCDQAWAASGGQHATLMPRRLDGREGRTGDE